MDLSDGEEYFFLHLMYARRAAVLGIVEAKYYHEVADRMYSEMVLVKEAKKGDRFLEMIRFMKNEEKKAVQTLVELRKDPKNRFPYTKDWDLKLSEVI
ncbi:hypothetical protein [Halobacillus seohaensis]|uniref:IDEAL domain-containing protein n=1 Tax=Halobacillus seohaensis TaxID=447421 RepID=A0ABW2EQI6_9BACI